MLRQDYQFGLFGALEDAKQYRQSLLAGLRKQVFVSRQTDDRRLIDDWQQWLWHAHRGQTLVLSGLSL